MEQKYLRQVIELVYLLNDAKLKNRAVIKMNRTTLIVVVYQCFFEEIDLSDSYSVYLGKRDAKSRFENIIKELNYYINQNQKSDEGISNTYNP